MQALGCLLSSRAGPVPRLLPRGLASSSSAPQEAEIVVPDRIERGPSALLRALAATVTTDYTAPHYKFHDDPWLIPYKNYSKRDYALAKEAGRKAARYIQNHHPDLFEHNRIHAEPPATAFQPRAAYNPDNVSVELLDNLVTCFQVEDAINVYSILKDKRKVIPVELRQSLLELVAFHNEEEAVEEGYEALGYVKNERSRFVQGGFAEQLYSEPGMAGEQARLAMLLGYARFHSHKKARQLWDECRANKDRLPVEAYNAFLASAGGEALEKNMTTAKEVLEQMAGDKVPPNTNTLIAMLKLVQGTARGPEYAQSCKYALDCVAEFRQAGVVLSLGVYKVLLDIFVDTKSRGPAMKSNILTDMLRLLEGRDLWPAVAEEDFYFFPTAMRVAAHLNKPDLAWEVNELLMTGNNLALLSSHDQEVAYYSAFVTNVLNNDSFEIAIELYNKVSPHLWCPNGAYYKTLLSAILSHGAVNHLGKVYDDMVLSDMGGSNKETNYELNYQVMQILKAHDPATSEFSGLAAVWLEIARRVFNHLEQHVDNKSFPLRFNTLAPNICNLCVSVNLDQGGYEEALKVFRFCQEQLVVMPGQLEEEVQRRLLDESLAQADTELALEVVKYALDSNSSWALQLGASVPARAELRPGQERYLDKLFAADPQWKPLQDPV